jgi:hypothetical protein
MPDYTEADVSRILEARAQGKLPGQIARDMNEPPAAPDDGPTDAERAAAAGEAAMSRGGVPAGEVPETPLGQDVMATAAKAGQYVRPDGSWTRPATGMSDAAVAAGFGKLFGRAVDGDPDAVFKRPDETVAQATERWRAREASKRGL